MPFEGYNYEDAICISARCVREDILTSVHVDEIVVELEESDELKTPMVLHDDGELRPLEYMENGIVKVGTWLETGDLAICCEMTEQIGMPNPFSGEIEFGVKMR